MTEGNQPSLTEQQPIETLGAIASNMQAPDSECHDEELELEEQEASDTNKDEELRRLMDIL